MKVLIDAGSLMKDLTGIGVYVKNLLTEMIPLDKSIHYYVFLNAFKGKTPNYEWQQAPNVTIIRKRIPGKMLLEIWRRNLPPTIESLARCQPDVFHSPNFFYHNTVSDKIVATVHDLAFLKRTDYGDRYSGAFHRELLKKKLKKISHFIVVSKTVQADLQAYFQIPEESITVIHHGVKPLKLSSDACGQLSDTNLICPVPEKYVLFVGTIEPRKNIPLLIRAFKQVTTHVQDIHLVIAGKPAEGLQCVTDAIGETRLHTKVHLTGYVQDNVLASLYTNAMLAVFPSWDEGFGFPPLEAMMYRTPVVASDIPVHREILQDNALFFRPNSADSLSKVLTDALKNLRKIAMKVDGASEYAKSYNWKNSAEKHLEVYRKVLSC